MIHIFDTTGIRDVFYAIGCLAEDEESKSKLTLEEALRSIMSTQDASSA